MKITNDRTAFYGIVGETIDIYQVEHAAAAAFNQLGGRASLHGIRQKVIVGRDANPSADMMEAAVCAALCASGADVLTIGTVPSAAVSYLTSCCDALMGIMITGSSQDSQFSGLKFYQSNGRQVTGELLHSIHASIDGHASLSSKQAGKIKKAAPDVTDIYIETILNAVDHVMFEKLSVAIDCTHSASAGFAVKIFSQMGADVKEVSHVEPASGEVVSSYTNHSSLIEFVRDNQCDLGFAFSADGEVCLAVDNEGKCYDTEKLAAVCSQVLRTPAAPDSPASMVLVSESCHAALAPYINSIGADCRIISGDFSHLLEETDGRRILLTADRNAGLLFPAHFRVPDGLLTAAVLLNCLSKSGMTLKELSLSMPKFARATSLVTIPASADLPDLGYTNLPEQIRKLRTQLSGDGKIVLTRVDRNKVNIIVEGVNQAQVASVAEQTERLVRKNLKETNGPVKEPLGVSIPPVKPTPKTTPKQETEEEKKSV